MSETAESEVQESLLSVTPEPEQDAEPEAMPHMEGDVTEPVESDFEWGERPDFMEGLDQFWSSDDGPDLEGLAKSYTELRSKMSSGKHKAPKDGNYDMSTLEGVPDDDPLLTSFTAFAKESGLSQDQFDQISKMYMENMGEMFGSVEVDVQREMDKLGKNADKVLQSTSQWLGKLQSSGVLTSEETEALTNAAQSADFVKAINKIRDSYGEKSIPAIEVQESGAMSKADLDAMVADPRYGKDMHYTQQVERKFMEFFGEA
jgi:hypothetical protein